MYLSGVAAYRPYIPPDYSANVARVIALLDAQTAAILQPVDGLRLSSAVSDVRISSYGRIQSDLAVLESVARALGGPDAFSRYSVKSTNPMVVTSYAQGSAVPGVYDIEVRQLAQGQTLVSAAQHDPHMDTGNGLPATVTFRFVNGESRSFTIDGGGDTRYGLSGIAADINQANIGIVASVAFDGSGFRLVLKGPGGASNAFGVTVTGNDAVSRLLSSPDGATSGAMSRTTVAQDAQVSVNGTFFSGHSNVFAGIAGGLTLNLNRVGSAALAVSPDTARITAAVQAFVDAYNIVQGNIAAHLAGDLSEDKALPAVKGRLSSGLAGGTSDISLTQAGLALNQDGTLSFDAGAFQDAYARNPEGVARLFTDGGNGLADRIAGEVHDVLQPGGDISSTISQLLSKIRDNQRLESDLEDKAFERLEYSAHHYAQQLSMLVIRQIMEHFFARQASNPPAALQMPNDQRPAFPGSVPPVPGFQVP